MSHIISNLADFALTVEQGVFEFFVNFGLLSAFLIFAFNLKPESWLKKVYWPIGLSSLLAPSLFFGTNWILEKTTGETLPVSQLLWTWLELWIGGIAFSIFWLRYVLHGLNTALAKIKKTSTLERNQKKTDVRDLAKNMPTTAYHFDPLKYINLKRGVFLGLDENKKPIYINFSVGASAPHIQVVGTTGAGKGVSLGVMGAQFLELGEAVFYCDPKDDEWAPHVLYATAQRTGKPFYFLNLNRPNGTQFNPFEGATEEEAFELFQAGFSLTEKGDASDFYGIADRREAGLTAKLMAEKNITIAQAYSERLSVLTNPNTGAEKFAGRLREMAETPSINAISGGIDLAKVIEEGGCVYIVGSMRNDIIKTVQRILLVRLIQLAERRDRIAGGLRPVCIVLDEVKYHLSRPALEALGAARDKGVHLVLAHQSLGDLRDCSKDLNPDAVVDAIVENCRIKICYRVLNPVTAEWLAAMSGEIQVDDETRKITSNLAQAEILSGDRSIKQSGRYFIDVNMLLNLAHGVSVVYGDGLPKFVSIQPLKVAKTPDAIEITIVKGANLPSSADAIALDAKI